jgi:hypothetical protein
VGNSQIVGQKAVGREKCYRVEWKNTWMPESEMVGAKGLVDAFIAKIRSGTTDRKRVRNQCGSAIEQSNNQVMEVTKDTARPASKVDVRAVVALVHDQYHQYFSKKHYFFSAVR